MTLSRFCEFEVEIMLLKVCRQSIRIHDNTDAKEDNFLKFLIVLYFLFSISLSLVITDKSSFLETLVLFNGYRGNAHSIPMLQRQKCL